jgi:hypothetical protein
VKIYYRNNNDGKNGNDAEARKIARAMAAKPMKISPATAAALARLPVREQTKSLESQDGIALLADPKVYTGDKMIGVATMHKSNAVPVFSSEAAQEISKMR